MVKTIIIIIICYLAVNLFAVLYSNHLIFLPPTPSYKDGKTFLKITTKSGAKISAIYLKNKNAKYTLLISHGNAEDLGYILPLLHALYAQNFSIFAYDYEGYGTSTGYASEQRSYQDIMAAYNYLTNKLHTPAQKIIGYGFSLGTAVTVDLATKKPLAGIILQSPFVSAFRVVTHFPILLFDKFNNLRKIPHIKCSVLFIHGTNDRIVPIWHSKKLLQAVKKPKYHLWVKNAGHNNLIRIAKNSLWHSINSFANTL